ncbi:MAG: bifunctional riboflavin kinase/FAD synthetase [Clostridia bacterium]|nr:bifunctional riboflavin kinase/FAD synthetase [Clostridia bacterium]
MTIYDLKTMQICDITCNTIVALGTFDGCHEGHRAIFGQAIRSAIKHKVKSAVFTFAEPPSISSKRAIYTLDEKISFIRKTGIDYLVVENFDAIHNLSGEEFFDSVLVSKLHAVGAVCGYNYRFGKNALCSAENLNDFFKKVGGSVDICPEITYLDRTVSSSRIRAEIENGNVESILPYSDPYTVYAIVEHGKKLGRSMGTPTINQHIPEIKVSPKRGVYITECEIGEDVYPSITNVGSRPTTDGDSAPENIETHIIGFDGDLYSSYIRVNFYKRLRDEKKFSSLEELTKQIANDCAAAKDYFLK